MRDVEKRADGFQAVRDARRNELVEDYVELIAELDASTGEARPVEIAARMGVTQPTVAKNLGRLKREGFITHERYRSVFLTGAGKALADRCRTRPGFSSAWASTKTPPNRTPKALSITSTTGPSRPSRRSSRLVRTNRKIMEHIRRLVFRLAEEAVRPL